MHELELGNLSVIVVSKCLAHTFPSAGIQLGNHIARCDARFCSVSLPWRRCAHDNGHSLWQLAESSTHQPQACVSMPENIKTPAPTPCRALYQNVFPPQCLSF